MDTVIPVQIIEKTACILHNANTPGKGINPIILPSAKRKIAEKTELSNLIMATRLEEGKLKIQTC